MTTPEQCGPPYELLLDMAARMVIVCDKATRQLLYANKPALKNLHMPDDYYHHACYEYLSGNKAPCQWCHAEELTAGSLSISEHYSPALDRYLKISREIIPWCGHSACVHFLEDVTERIIAEKKLQETQKLYEMAIHAADIAVWDYYIPEKKVVMSNTPFTAADASRFLPMPVIEDVPQALIKYIAPQDVAKFLSMYDDVHAGKPVTSCEVWYNIQNSTEPRCEKITYYTVCDNTGQPVHAYGIGQNITAQRLEKNKYTNFIQDMLSYNPQNLGAFHLNISRNLCLNGRGTSPDMQTGFASADDFFQHIAAGIIVPADAERFLQIFNRKSLLKQFSTGQHEAECRYQRPLRGEICWISCYICMVQNPSTGEVEAIVNALDMNEQKRSKDIIQHITNEEYDFIGLIDIAAGQLEFRTKRTGTIEHDFPTRLPYVQALSAVAQKYVLPEEQGAFSAEASLAMVCSELAHNQTYACHFIETNGYGQISRKQLKYSYLDETKCYILIIKSDISRVYDRELNQIKLLHDAMIAAKHANDLKSSFLSNISHDMRTPLNGIIGFTALARKASSCSQLEDYLQKIDISSQLLLSLINDTLELSKIESGQLTINVEPVDSQQLLKDIAVPITLAAESKHITFRLNDCRTYKGTVRIDKLKFQKIALNLLSNAIKFTTTGGNVSMTIRDHHSRNRLQWQMFIHDTGCGISTDFLPKIFEPFTQEYTPHNPNPTGSGLGLSIVKRLLELLGGNIRVRSKPQHGTIFLVTLDVEPTTEQAIKAMPQHSSKMLTDKCILLCEDNALNAEIATQLLTSAGLKVTYAANGQQGIEAFLDAAPGSFSAILMDIRMPVMNGYEATAAIRHSQHRDASTIPIIAMTADAYAEDIAKCFAAGMDAHLPKPIDINRLLQTLQEKCC